MPDREARGDKCDGLNGAQLRRCTRDNPNNFREQCAAMAGPKAGFVMGTAGAAGGAALSALGAQPGFVLLATLGTLAVSGMEAVRWETLRCDERLGL